MFLLIPCLAVWLPPRRIVAKAGLYTGSTFIDMVLCYLYYFTSLSIRLVHCCVGYSKVWSKLGHRIVFEIGTSRAYINDNKGHNGY